MGSHPSNIYYASSHLIVKYNNQDDSDGTIACQIRETYDIIQTSEGYISKDIYPILISPNRQKRIFPITVWRRIFWGYNILILGVSKFISYILFWRFFNVQSTYLNFAARRRKSAFEKVSLEICWFMFCSQLTFLWYFRNKNWYYDFREFHANPWLVHFLKKIGKDRILFFAVIEDMILYHFFGRYRG
jgi:hypothetical protein